MVCLSVLAEALEEAIEEELAGEGLSPQEQHDRLKSIYKWEDVAERTEVVYRTIRKQPIITVKHRINR